MNVVAFSETNTIIARDGLGTPTKVINLIELVFDILCPEVYLGTIHFRLQQFRISCTLFSNPVSSGSRCTQGGTRSDGLQII